MVKKNYIKIIFCTVLALSCMLSFGEMTAYAASLKAPSITSENTSATSVKLKWKKDSSAKKFTIYRSTNKSKGYKVLKTVNNSTLSYTDKKLTCGKTYYYKVKAINGKNSKTSKVKSVKVVPKKVSSISAISAKCGEITVNYGKSSGASGYQLCTSNSANGKFTPISTANVTSVTQNVQMGSTAYYKVRAYKTVNGKKVYSAYSKTIAATALSHTYSSVETVIGATCTQGGLQKYTCTVCGNTYTQATDKTSHSYVAIQSVPATCGTDGYTLYKCSVCGDEYKSNFTPATGQHSFGSSVIINPPTCTSAGTQSQVCSVCGYAVKSVVPPLGHDMSKSVVTQPTCTESGYTTHFCTRCDYSEVSDFTEPLGHTTDGSDFYISNDGKLVKNCTRCGDAVEMSTYSVDISSLTDFELDGVAKFESAKQKLTLTSSSVASKFEITGNANDITISIDATDASIDTEIKLNNATVNNSTLADDCIRINDKSPLNENDDGTDEVPLVSISAKDGTENTLSVTGKGNAIDSNTKLELKGHGTLNITTGTSTSINSIGKVTIKNLTLDIKSQNRGIDTKDETTDPTTGLVINEDYASIEVGANANVTINSVDDGIRCKNIEFLAIDSDKNPDDLGSVFNITAGADGIQLEGKKGITMNSGTMTLSGVKYDINFKKTNASVTINNNAVLNYKTTNRA